MARRTAVVSARMEWHLPHRFSRQEQTQRYRNLIKIECGMSRQLPFNPRQVIANKGSSLTPIAVLWWRANSPYRRTRSRADGPPCSDCGYPNHKVRFSALAYEVLADTYEITILSALLPSRIQMALCPPCTRDRSCAVTCKRSKPCYFVLTTPNGWLGSRIAWLSPTLRQSA